MHGQPVDLGRADLDLVARIVRGDHRSHTGRGWYDDTNGEIGDICAWKTKKVGNYTVQLEWSNKANQCI